MPIERIDTDAPAAKQDFNDLQGSIPKVNVPSTVNTPGGSIYYNPGGKANLRGQRLAKQIRGFGLGHKTKGIKGGGAKVGGFGSVQEADAYINSLKGAAGTQGTGAFNDVDYEIRQGKKGFKVLAKAKNRQREVNFTQPQAVDGQGNPIDNPVGNQVDTVNDINTYVRQLYENLYPKIQQGAEKRADTYSGIQDSLGREAAGVGELSPEQQAQIDSQLAAAESRGTRLIRNKLMGDVRGITADLRGSGFASSNLADINLQEGAYNTAEDAYGKLGEDLASQEQNIRNSIAERQNAGVETLSNIANAQAPEMTQAQQLQDGTFQRMPTMAEITALSRLYNLDIPGQDQQAMLELMKTIIGNQSAIQTPSAWGQLLGAGATVAGGALGALGR